MPNVHVNPRRAGFTLLELLVSIVLFSSILLIVSGAVRLGYRSVSSGEKKINDMERLRSSLSIIEAQIQSALPLSYQQGQGVKQLYFQGTEHSLRLATSYSIRGGQKGYVIVEYRAVMDDGGTWSLYESENMVGTRNPRETILLRALTEIHFDYFFKDPTEESGKWTSTWNDPVALPEKVRIRLAAGRNDVSLVVPMRVQKLLARADADVFRFLPRLSEKRDGKAVERC
ncbi:MAG: general secretion pathway protein J [Syntrophorhabdaceae bacterium PtaU1.Bin034]|jgi:prepilin-type N-terminal cleavage/methylation domain-containing protein|nr:MAG: general secretion pathway protein J [Syntrophorhabdaceae bacterium PtaU1.Bin034]